jgi:hypothetical protein
MGEQGGEERWYALGVDGGEVVFLGELDGAL